MKPGIGDLVRFTTDFPIMGIWEGDTATLIGVAQWGEWRLLVNIGGGFFPKAFPESVFEVIESVASREESKGT